MRYDPLLEDVAEPEHVAALRQLNISSYRELFALLRDESAEPTSRIRALDILTEVNFAVDKRRAVWPVLAALNSPNDSIRSAAFRALGILGSRQAVPRLIELALDSSQITDIRFDAVYTLGNIGDKRAMVGFRRIYRDQTDDIHVRSLAIEQTTNIRTSPNDDVELVRDYVDLLADDSADIRFWAAFGLGSLVKDKTPALEALDRVVAFDHRVPIYWGWHVDREAILALEHGYSPYCNHSDTNEYTFCNVFLISPAPEYFTFQQQYRNWRKDWKYSTRPTPSVTLRVDRAWFAEKLSTHWPEIKLNTRQPRPLSYLVDFALTIEQLPLSGGLHRDGYALVLTGGTQAIAAFAAWYRGIIAPEQPLYLYLWADSGTELTVGIGTDEVKAILKKLWPYRERD
ncbi:MAG: HEAT repeat domain-containing protein [Aggregatilineales bacterium]